MNSLRNSISELLVYGYKLLIKLSSYLQPVILLIFRLTWGWQLFQTGWGKLTNHAHVVSFFTDLGIPLPELNAWFVGGLECFGGLLLLIGFFSRPIALLMTGNMVVAYLSVEADRASVLNIFSDPVPFLSADPFFVLLLSILVLAFGPGALSIDYLLKRRFFCSQKCCCAIGEK